MVIPLEACDRANDGHPSRLRVFQKGSQYLVSRSTLGKREPLRIGSRINGIRCARVVLLDYSNEQGRPDEHYDDRT
jgi:hypothetical protein